ncbi:hypothetical protein HPP92_027214 [Vanilla planifolia]|uniref:Remorin C-terminal domain-containing protein n=1 Tax=Vanilla planifolia TaxID=51239 RepID=A0A835U642_VANPL|nr:hypothetical protein HPP92_027214 [Vanilla planifolia]
MFPSPGTPNYWHSGSGASSYQKGWSSERVPLPASRGQRFGVNAPLFPYNNGRTMPSKWEDAERWICSPVSGDGSRRPLMLPPYHRRPKSKSGPLGALASAGGSYPSNSPQIPCFDNGRVVNCTGTSPFLAGVLVTDTQVCSFSGGVDVVEGYVSGEKLWTPTYIDRSTSMHGWLDMLTGPSSLLHSSNKVSQGNAVDRTKESTMLSPITLRRDMGTQMSPVGSTHSSPRERPPISHSPPSVHTITDLQSYFPCLEIRDVQVDDCVTVNRWSKKHISRCSDKRSTDIIEWKRKLESPSSHWEVVEAEKKASNFDREEAKIAAWENLQKAKAEAALQKLEMKLEKKRSSSMDKILRRLGSAQRKAEDMRSSVVTRSSRMVSYSSKHRRISSLRGCFTCHTF